MPGLVSMQCEVAPKQKMCVNSEEERCFSRLQHNSTSHALPLTDGLLDFALNLLNCCFK